MASRGATGHHVHWKGALNVKAQLQRPPQHGRCYFPTSVGSTVITADNTFAKCNTARCDTQVKSKVRARSDDSKKGLFRVDTASCRAFEHKGGAMQVNLHVNKISHKSTLFTTHVFDFALISKNQSPRAVVLRDCPWGLNAIA